MFSWHKYLIVSLGFSHLGFWSGNLFLIAPFPDLCLLVPSYMYNRSTTLECSLLFVVVSTASLVIAGRLTCLKAALRGHICGKIPTKSPGSPEADNNMEQQLVVILMKTYGIGA